MPDFAPAPDYPFPDKKYNILLADPPWAYRDKREGRDGRGKFCGGASRHYPTMEIEALKELPVQSLAAENCILFMWVTWPNLQEGLDLIKAWGFTYKTIGFCWVKINKNDRNPFFGIGHYTRSNTEPCLIGVKGHPRINNGSISQVIMAPRQEHSRKPAIVRDKIVELMGDLPRIELFARQAVKNWDSWGNHDLTNQAEQGVLL